ncbi:MAG: hypothetical protein OEQ39_18250, partial [Gammaproteobacteria bacterium]|nr:hypothetical protein [Gammaproteobacteria bacterium]
MCALDIQQTKNESLGISGPENLPLLSVIVPVFNEQALLESHLDQVVSYLESIEDEFRWEVVIVNDG